MIEYCGFDYYLSQLCSDDRYGDYDKINSRNNFSHVQTRFGSSIKMKPEQFLLAL